MPTMAGTDVCSSGGYEEKGAEGNAGAMAQPERDLQRQSERQSEWYVALFYRYCDVADPPAVGKALRSFPGASALCGRLLVAAEGINGTFAAPSPDLRDRFERWIEAAAPGFAEMEWKESSGPIRPFPDLVVKVVPALIAGIPAGITPAEGGRHVSPTEFHRLLADRGDAVLIDVRNDFEHALGHFVTPDGAPAESPAMKSFADFPKYAAEAAERCRGKRVLMYCTGGIRCEKASALLKAHGVDDVVQLHGGIHRYLEAYPEGGHFRGKNFVFDKRVALGPEHADVVGKCCHCSAPCDEVRGDRVCTVCRQLVVICGECRAALPEYHCPAHRELRRCYFTFLEHFSLEALREQEAELSRLIADIDNPHIRTGKSRNCRKTLARQWDRVAARIADMAAGRAAPPDPEAPPPRRCRTCYEANCNGLCWGFWREAQASVKPAEVSAGDAIRADVRSQPISVGARVRRGPHWNPRYGDQDGGGLGTVIEMKHWAGAAAAALGPDAVHVRWDCSGKEYLYRWGAPLADGQQAYDVAAVATVAGPSTTDGVAVLRQDNARGGRREAP